MTSIDRDRYEVRIFTPAEELGFAGHPTIGTAWVLRHLGRIDVDEVEQRSRAGSTIVRFDGGRASFTRTGTPEEDIESHDPTAARRLAAALGLAEADVALEARELGRSGMLRPAYSDAGLRHLLVPVRDLKTLSRIGVRADQLDALEGIGAYCFTAVAAGKLRARGFFPALRIQEDPATGSAAASLGLYLADRVGAIDVEIAQGEEMGRPSKLHLRADPGTARVSGGCVLVARGKLEEVP